MQIIRNSIETATGPSEWFTGTVYIDTVATPSEPSRLGAASVHFAPGARTAWHTHPLDQTVYVTEGLGLCQRRGGSVEVIRPGDRVFFEPGEDHWHGAAPNRLMIYSRCRRPTIRAARSRRASTSPTRSTAPRRPSTGNEPRLIGSGQRDPRPGYFMHELPRRGL